MEKKKEIDSVMTICSSRTDEHPPVTVGIWVPCTGCKADVWLSDTSVSSIKQQHPHIVDANGILPYCFTCGFAEIEKMKDPQFLQPTSEQVDEIVESIVKKNAE